MPLQDVSQDTSMIDWLRSSGHAHLLAQDNHYSSAAVRSASPPVISGEYATHTADQYHTSHNQSASFSQAYHAQPSPTNFVTSPTQFIAPHNNPQLDMDIENLKRDPNTRVIHRPPNDDVVYRQRVFVRYLQPPTPPAGGAIIVREKQPPPPPPEPPIVIKRAPPPQPTPPPVVIRERPPPIPVAEPTTVINKIIPPPPPAPRQVIIEQYPSLPPKPQDVIVERWLPLPPRQRRIIYERLPPSALPQPTAPIIVQHGPPRVRIHRELINVPGAQVGLPQASYHTDVNQLLHQLGVNQQYQTNVAPSSLVSYSPFSNIQQSYGPLTSSQSNVVVLQADQSNVIAPSSYGIPMSCVCPPTTVTGIGSYGSGLSTIPTVGYSSGQTQSFSIPENVPVDNILRQLGVDPHSLQQSSANTHDAVSHVWHAASHAVNPNPYSHQSNNPVPQQQQQPLSSGSGVLSRLFSGNH